MTQIIGYPKMACVFTAIGVAVTNERCFPVVMEMHTLDSDVVCRMCDIEKTIVVILKILFIPINPSTHWRDKVTLS